MTTSDDGLAPRDEELLHRTIALAARARWHGDQPFGALVLAADGRVVAEAGNREITAADPTAHAEMLALRETEAVLAPSGLAGATAYASTEPCPMCAAGLYWAGVGRIVFALGGSRLYGRVGAMAGNQLHLGSRELVERGQREVRVTGPAGAGGLHDAALAVHDGFW